MGKKLRTFDKIIATILCVVGVAFFLLMLLLSLNVIDPSSFFNGLISIFSAGDYPNQATATLIMVVSIIFICLILVMYFIVLFLINKTKTNDEDVPGSASYSKRGIVVRNSDNGAIHMTRDALQYLVDQHIKESGKVRDCTSYVQLADDSATIQVYLSAMGDVNLPEVSGEMQEDLKDYIQTTTGINVTGVEMIITAPTTVAPKGVKRT